MRVREMNRFPFSINPNNSRRNLFIYYYLDFGRRPTLHTFSEYVDVRSKHIDFTRTRTSSAHIRTSHTRHDTAEKKNVWSNQFNLSAVRQFLCTIFFFLFFSRFLLPFVQCDSPRRCYHYAMLCQHLLSVFHLKTMLFSLQKCVETMRWRKIFDPAVFHRGLGMNGAHEKCWKSFIKKIIQQKEEASAIWAMRREKRGK